MHTPAAGTPVITKEQLEKLTKDQLIALLSQALEGQSMATRNMKALNDMLAAADLKARELESRCQSLEAENIALRSRP